MKWISSFSAQDQEINVQCHLFIGEAERLCAAPFSWLIKAYCQSLWEESEFVRGEVFCFVSDYSWPVSYQILYTLLLQ